MYSNSNKAGSYSKMLFIISLLTVISAFGAVLLGYVFLPFAAASYAALLLFENKSRRILSYILPVTMLIVNFLFNGFYSLEGLVYVVVGFLIYIFYTKSVKKSEVIFYLTATVTLFIAFSIVFFAFKINDSASISSLIDFYSHIYSTQKSEFISFFSNLVTVDTKGVSFFVFTKEYAEQIYHTVIMLLPSVAIIIALLLSGLTLKIFFVYLAKLGADKEVMVKWTYVPTRFFAFAYISFALLNIFTSNAGGILSISIINVNYIFAAIFAYVGTKFIYIILRARNSGFFAVFMIFTAIAFLGLNAILLLSYIGVYFSLFASHSAKKRQD